MHNTVANESSKWLSHLASFLAVVEAGSFTAAARVTGDDKTVLSRRVTKLEEVLQVRLLNRTTRSLHVTEAGRRLVEESSRPLADATLALTRAVQADVVRGTVRVSSMTAFSSVWSRVLPRLLAAHPELSVEMENHDGFVNLVERGNDLSICSGHLPDSSQVARRLGSWRYVLVASPDWVARHPHVRRPADLPPHWLLYGDVPHARRWSFECGDEGEDVVMEGRVRGNDGAFLVEQAVAGLGVMAAPPFLVAREMQRGDLVELLSPWRVAHVHQIWSLVPHRAFVPARVQVVLDAVGEAITELAPTWGA